MLYHNTENIKQETGGHKYQLIDYFFFYHGCTQWQFTSGSFTVSLPPIFSSSHFLSPLSRNIIIFVPKIICFQ